LNRNYGFNWGKFDNPGDAASFECEGDTYRGAYPFSEPET